MIAELAPNQPNQPTTDVVAVGTPTQSPDQTIANQASKSRVDFSDPDIVNRKTGKTLYEASVWEIFWRNLLAGMSRGLGNLILVILFSLIVGNLFMTYVWPYLEPIFDSFATTNELLDFVEGFMNAQGQPNLPR